MGTSSIDRIRGHLETRGADAPLPEDLRADAELLVRRCDEVRSLGQAYGSVELSPYMQSLLRISGVRPRGGLRAASAGRAAVAGV
ncbi:MAG: hypothetical protein M5U26_22245 [Planctomycetota bacterium]|nr:hypothetical protein [Planctomycetota bacterium]